MRNPPTDDDAWERLIGELEQDESILDQTVRDLRATVPGYENVPTASLEASARRNIALSIRTIRAGREPSRDDVAEADALAVERQAQGVPVGSVLAGFRVCLSIILHRLLTLAPAHGIPADQVLASSTLLWALGDAFSSRAVLVYQEKEVARTLADSARRAAWIGDAVSTWMDPAELSRGAALYDIPTLVSVRAVVARSRPGSDVERQRLLHEWADDAGVRILTAVRASSLVGLIIGDPKPRVHPKDLTVGVGRPTSLDQLPRSFESASLALRAAESIGEAGVVDVDGLSWRVGIHASPEVTEMLHELYMVPLEQEGPFGEHVIEATEAYLQHRLNIPLAARSIPVHVNTLRYRLRRFSQLTGADLGDLDTLVEVSWALSARAGRVSDHRSTS